VRRRSRKKGLLPVKAFLDILDGRTIWRDRELPTQQVNRCLHCLDHFSRMWRWWDC